MPDAATILAEKVLEFGQLVKESFGSELFENVGLHILLALFIKDGRGRRVTGQSIADTYGIDPALASRWVKLLSARGLIVGDGDGDLSDELTLTGQSLESLERLIDTVANFAVPTHEAHSGKS